LKAEELDTMSEKSLKATNNTHNKSGGADIQKGK